MVFSALILHTRLWVFGGLVGLGFGEFTVQNLRASAWITLLQYPEQEDWGVGWSVIEETEIPPTRSSMRTSRGISSVE